jgi:hypothetical protein
MRFGAFFFPPTSRDSRLRRREGAGVHNEKKKKSTRLPAETLCNQNNNSNNKQIHPKLFKKFLSRTHADKSRINKH